MWFSPVLAGTDAGTAESARTNVTDIIAPGHHLEAPAQTPSGWTTFRLPNRSEVVHMGGPGFVAPGGIAETTVPLEPGAYAIECYVKAHGVFHSTHGIITGLTVTEEESGASEPRADIELPLTSADG